MSNHDDELFQQDASLMGVANLNRADGPRPPTIAGLLGPTSDLKTRIFLTKAHEARAFQFQTVVDGEPRTVGTIFRIPSATRLTDWAETDAQALGRMHEVPANTQATARGKVVFLEGATRGRVFQVRRREASAVACGNATAAAASVIAEAGSQRSVQFLIEAPALLVRVTAHTSGGFACRHVEQAWDIEAEPQIRVVELAGARIPLISFLNDYLILDANGPLTPEEALHLAHRDLAIPKLRAKAAVVHPGQPPFLRFYGCNGPHGAAPLTGLSTIALAATHLPWLKRLTGPGVIRHPGGIDQLPHVRPRKGGVVIELPAVDVRLQRLT